MKQKRTAASVGKIVAAIKEGDTVSLNLVASVLKDYETLLASIETLERDEETLADTQRAIIEAAEARGYERALKDSGSRYGELDRQAQLDLFKSR